MSFNKTKVYLSQAMIMLADFAIRSRNLISRRYTNTASKRSNNNSTITGD